MSTEEIFGWIAIILSIIIFASPAFQFIKVFNGHLDYDHTPIIFIVTIYCNCFTWYIYGDLVSNKKIKTCNILGFIISLILIIIYLFYEIKKFFMDAILNIGIILTGTWATYRFITIVLADSFYIGKLCILTSLIPLMCPLELLYRVVKEKSYKFISFLFIEIILANEVCWAIYGFIIKDYYIILGNLFGVVFVISRIIFNKIYKNKYTSNGKNGEISTIGIESIGNDAFSKKSNSAVEKIDDENFEDGDNIKAKPVEIISDDTTS